MSFKTPASSSSFPWWIATLYFAEGLPYMAVMTISVIMYKSLGIGNTAIAFYTSWLYLPWMIKPLWSPFVDIIRTKRWWIVAMQLSIAIGMALIAFTIPASLWFQTTLAVFWLVAFSSATHDIAADGYYMLALNEHEQSFFVGIRSLFYRISMVIGQGALVVLADQVNRSTGTLTAGWIIIFALLSAFFLIVALLHMFKLPVPRSDVNHDPRTFKEVMQEFISTFISFFRKPGVAVALVFILLYRLPEALMVKMIPPFLQDPVAAGGIGLSAGDVGLVYGTVGVIGLMLGGIIGGIAASSRGLRAWLHPMAWSMSLTCLTFVYLAWAQPTQIWQVYACVFIEQFGYGFGFTAYMLYMMYFSEGEFKTSHYAICTAFMALSMMLPGFVAGYIQEAIGYVNFFWMVMACCIATLIVTYLVDRKIDPNYGKK